MINPFQWKNGKAMTPEEVERARQLADAALGRAGDTSPVGHWTQGAARVIDTLGGVLKDKRASKAEKAGLAGADAYVQSNPVLAALLGGGGGNFATGGYSGGGSSFMAQPTTMPAAPDVPNMGADVSPEELAAMDAASVGSWNGGPIDAMKPEAFSTFGVGQGPDTGYAVPAEPKSYIPEEIKNGIFAGESGGDYNALFGFSNRPGGKFANVKLTDMTVDQALNFAAPSGEYGQTVKGQIGRVATPMGAYQVVGTTLRAAKEGLGLTGNEVMTPELQDQIGAWILAEQGTGAWEGYKGPRDSYTPASGGYSGGGMSSGGSPIPMSGGGAGSMSAITAALSDPWVAKKYGPVLNALMGQEMKRGDMQYEAQLRQSDPMYQAQLKAAEAALQPAPMKPIEVGGVLLDPVTYQPIFDSRSAEESARPMTPDERAAYGIPATDVTPYKMTPNGPVAIGGGGVNVTVGGGPEMGKLSPDFGYVLDPVTRLPVIDEATGLPKAAPVPGSPAALEAQAAAAADERALGNADTASDGILAAATRAREAAKERVAGGLIGKAAALNPGSKNAEVYRQVDVLKSNAKISNLQAMRDASKTGGALGAVTAPELKMLEDKSGALDPASPYFERDLADYTLTLLKTVHGPEAGQLIFDQQYAGMTPPAGGGASTAGLPPGFVED